MERHPGRQFDSEYLPGFDQQGTDGGPRSSITIYLDRQSGTVSAYQRNPGEWASLTANDPDKLFTMRAACLYRRVTGAANDEDQEILAEFYYRHFEITDQTLDTLRQGLPDVYQQLGAKLEKLKNIEYLSAESFEKRLKDLTEILPNGSRTDRIRALRRNL